MWLNKHHSSINYIQKASFSFLFLVLFGFLVPFDSRVSSVFAFAQVITSTTESGPVEATFDIEESTERDVSNGKQVSSGEEKSLPEDDTRYTGVGKSAYGTHQN